MYTQGYQPELTSSEQAMELGFVEGESLRKNGAKREDLDFNIELYRGNYPRSQFYSWWLKGFSVGFLCDEKKQDSCSVFK